MELFEISFNAFKKTLGPYKSDSMDDLRIIILNTPNSSLPQSIQDWKNELDMYLEERI